MAAPDSEKATNETIDSAEPKSVEDQTSSWNLLKKLTRSPQDDSLKPEQAGNSLAKLLQTANADQTEVQKEAPEEVQEDEEVAKIEALQNEVSVNNEDSAVEAPVAAEPASELSAASSNIRYAQSLRRVEEQEQERAQKQASEQTRNLSRNIAPTTAAPASKIRTMQKGRPNALLIGGGVAAVLAIVGGVAFFSSNNSGSKLVVESNAYFKEKKYDKALDAANQAINANAQDAGAYYARARVFKLLNLNKESLDDYQKGMSIKLPDASTRAEIGESLVANEKYKEALELYDDLLSSTSPPPEDYQYAGRAYAYVKLGQYQKAIDDYEQAIRLNSKNPAFLAGDAYAYSQMHKYVQAISIYTAALSMQPNDIDALLHRAWCQEQRGQSALAAADIAKAKKLAPTSGLPLYFEALILNQKKQEAKAMERLNAAIALEPQCKEALQLRGDTYAKEKAWDKAFADYQALGKLGANSAPYLMTFADLGEKTGKNDQVVHAYTTILAVAPKNTKALLGRAKALLAMQKYKDSIADCNTILSATPNNSQALYLRGRGEEAMNNPISALNDFISAINADNKNWNAYVSRGTYFLNKKDYISAANDFERALSLNPGASEAASKRQIAMSAVKKMSIITPDRSSQVSSRFTPKVVAAMSDKDLISQGYRQLTSGNFADAVPILEAAVTRHPDDMEARRYLAHALTGTMNFAAALQQFNAIASVKPLQLPDEVKFGLCLINTGQVDKAVDLYMKLLVSHPADPRISLGLAKAYASQGQVDKALRICEGAAKGPGSSELHEYYESLRSSGVGGPGNEGKGGIDIGG